MEILAQLRALSFGTAAAFSVLLILLTLGITIVAYYRLRAKVDGAGKRISEDKPHDGDDTKRLEEKAPSDIADYANDMDIPAALNNSFGFGGHNVALIFTRI